jgi:DUF3006 family protein
MASERQREKAQAAIEAGANAGDDGISEPAHRWAIDRIEEGTAAVEQDGDHVYEIPRFLVPRDARDGDVVTVLVTATTPGAVTLSVHIDRAASAPRPGQTSTTKKRRAGNDPGGDIVL